MKPRCPARCGRELGPSFVLCAECYATVPREMKDAVSRYGLLIRRTRNPILQRKYFGEQRAAKERAVQFVIDRRNKEKVSA